MTAGVSLNTNVHHFPDPTLLDAGAAARSASGAGAILFSVPGLRSMRLYTQSFAPLCLKAWPRLFPELVPVLALTFFLGSLLTPLPTLPPPLVLTPVQTSLSPTLDRDVIPAKIQVPFPTMCLGVHMVTPRGVALFRSPIKSAGSMTSLLPRLEARPESLVQVLLDSPCSTLRPMLWP